VRGIEVTGNSLPPLGLVVFCFGRIWSADPKVQEYPLGDLLPASSGYSYASA
jgi:hypothetical protein